jgi:alpha-L-rhamnosidase
VTRAWTAQMITTDDAFAGAPLLRTEFALEAGHGTVARAELHATALGVFEAYLAGQPVSDEVLSPGWSAYEWRLRYRSYDVTDTLRGPPAGRWVVFGLALGKGWAAGRLGWSGGGEFYTRAPAALAELEITFTDGHVQTVVTDASWQAGPSAVLANDLYDGQTIDARLRNDAWLQPGEPDSWVGVHAVEFDAARLTPYLGPVVRRQETIRPVRIWTSPAGRTLVDFGQNLVGWVRVTVHGEAGSTVTLRHAEVLENSELGVRPLRTAAATDRYVLSGAVDIFEPTFTFHGFRYAEVQGWPGEPAADDLTAVVVHSQLTRIGTFECSDELLNQLHRNVVWGLRGNFLDVPTDCPQRDERLGWTGDIAAFGPTAAYLFDVAGFLDDWLADVDAEQTAAGGMMPFVVPDILKYVEFPADFPDQETTAIWGDAAVWVPWALWMAYGDAAALARHYRLMTAHLRHVAGLLSEGGLWDEGFQFGDWLDPNAPPADPFKANADNGVVATASYLRSLDLARRAAAVLGHEADAAEFSAQYERSHHAFLKHYVRADGTILSDCPTVYALAIAFGLLDGDVRQAAGRRLAGLVEQGGYRIATGFAGTPFVCDALASTGHLDAAYRLLLQRECPSWLYPITMGATTIWERWDSMLPDGSINPGEMTSFNHYALGAVADWMHRTIGGITPLTPGYDRVLVAPEPGGGITWARAAIETRHGRIAANWAIDDTQITLTLDVPDGVTASVRLPGIPETIAGPGHHQVSAHVAHPNARRSVQASAPAEPTGGRP